MDPAHSGPIWPLVGRSGLVLVDHQAICAACGMPVAPIAPEGWRHVRRSGRRGRPPAWLRPVRLRDLGGIATYADFGVRFPWAVRAEVAGPAITTEAAWREGLDRLLAYRDRLRRLDRSTAIEPGANPYLEILGLLAVPSPSLAAASAPADEALGGAWGLPAGLTRMLSLGERRRELAARFSWAIPSADALDILVREAPLLETGAGSGYWAGLLRARGASIQAFDIAPPGGADRNLFFRSGQRAWTDVGAADARRAVHDHPDRTLFICWPPPGDDLASYAPLRAYRGERFVYAGEAEGGATGSVRFHRELRLNWELEGVLDLPHWPRLRDRLWVYRRAATRRHLTERDRCDSCRRFVATGRIGRCERCSRRRPPALAIDVEGQRMEYSAESLAAMVPALRRALERSPSRIR